MANTTPTTNPPLTTGQWKPIATGMAELVRGLADAALAHPRNDHLRAWLAADPLRAEPLAAELAWLVLRGIAIARARTRGLITIQHEPAPNPDIPILNLAALRAPHNPTTARPELITEDSPAFFPRPTIDEDTLVIAATTVHEIQARITHFASGPVQPILDTRFLSLAYEATLAWSATLKHGPASGDSPRLHLNPRTGKARHAAGAFSTPDPLIGHVLARTLEPSIADHLHSYANDERALFNLRICDPAVGVGRFLIAAGWHLSDAIASRSAAPDGITSQAAFARLAETQLVGVDNDPKAVALCRIALWLESNNPSRCPADFAATIRLGNALLGVPLHALPQNQLNQHTADNWCAQAAFGQKKPPKHDAPRFFQWPITFPDGFDVIIGNPPFLNQLRSSTASARWQTALLRARTNNAIRRYADVSAAFLMLALELARPSARIGLVMPQSTLAAADLTLVRQRTLELAELESLWVSQTPVFPGTDVQACAITLRKRDPLSASFTRSPLHRTTGSTFHALSPLELTDTPEALAHTWGPLIAEAFGVPTITIPQTHRTTPTIAELATATADFRDQYYGLVGHLIEHDHLSKEQLVALATDPNAYPKLITSGLIALANNQWSQRPNRIHKHTWQAPRVNAATLRETSALATWLDARLVPKLLVATQTRIIQAIADERGDLLPSVPVLTVIPHDSADLWKLAAAVCSPVSAAIAMARYPGTALTRDAIKLSAKQLLALPLPTSDHAWQEAADHFQAATHAPSHDARAQAITRYAHACTRAHQMNTDEANHLLAWWLARGPAPRKASELNPKPAHSDKQTTPST